ncbi:MAG: hypothetical protein EON59_04775 [Alphaproteobacteria bacterium]|nr:MAG: hypothetical protein EON59_04775 [Alphaproteobacteria bacterium]
MIDPSKVDPRLAAQFIARARRAEAEGFASGSTTEQIVSAFLTNRQDWLPERWTMLDALDRLHLGGPDWFHTMMAVNSRGWRQSADMHDDRPA